MNKAIQDRACLINKGKEEYNRYVPQARGLARLLIFSAEGYAAQRINRATGETQRFSPLAAEYARYPKVTRTRLYFEAFEQAFAGSNGTDIIDKKLSGSILSKDTVEPSPTDQPFFRSFAVSSGVCTATLRSSRKEINSSLMVFLGPGRSAQIRK